MKTKIIVMTEPNAWNMTDQQTGEFRSGNSATAFIPEERTIQDFSDFPKGVEFGKAYEADLGLKAGKDANGKRINKLVLRSIDLNSAKIIDWDKLMK